MSRKLLIALLSVALGLSSLACGSDSNEKNEAGSAGAVGSAGGTSGSGAGSAGTGTSSSGQQLTDARDGHVYPTKAFGPQVWMTENLAVGASYNPRVSHELVGDIQRWCPQTHPDFITPSPCDSYGGYYTWAQALALPAECNTSDCAAQVQTPHHGICPAGFHIPSKAEFEALANFVATETGLGGKDEMGRYSQVGAALRTNSACTTPGTVAPSSGFNALPSGYGDDGGYVTANGIWTFFQSTTQDPQYSYGWHVSCADDLFIEGLYYKDHALPVRCVKD